MKFTLEITNYDNAAMACAPFLATAEALEQVARKIEDGRRDGLIVDENGNKVGSWEFTEEIDKIAR